MTRRSSPQSRIDDVAFPVRVKVTVPARGFGNPLDALHHWLRELFGPGNYAHHATDALACEATAFYFRRIEDAEAFVAAHPDLELADGTLSRAYSAPGHRAEGEDFSVCNLYSMTRTQDEMRDLFAPLGAADRLGNLAPLDEMYPDYRAPILRNGEERRQLDGRLKRLRR